jgi:hypothetical protein
MRGLWAVSVASVGLLLVGVVYACILYAMPNRGIARDWPIYGPVLFGPYALAALACWLSRSRFVRVLAVFSVLAGAAIAAAAMADAWPTFRGGRPPAMPGSALVSGILLMGQYSVGAIAALLASFKIEKSTQS